MVKALLSKSTTITHFYRYVVFIHVSIHGARNNKTEPVSFILYQTTNHSPPSVVFRSAITKKRDYDVKHYANA
jgi:hypothetical protein